MIYLADGERQEVHLSHYSMQQQAKTLAAHLQQRFQPGDRAVLLFGEGIDIIPAFFGVLYAGMVAVPLIPPRPGQPIDDLVSLMTDAQPSVLLTTTGLSGFLQPLLARDATPPIINIETLDSLENFPWQRPAITSGSLASLLYTSGSTSTPRGVMMTHGHLLHRLAGYAALMERIGSAGMTLNWLPIQHLMGLVASVLQPMYAGIQTVVLPTSKVIEQPLRWLQAMSRFRANSSASPNFALQMCLDRIQPEDRQGLDLSAWQHAFLSSEAIRSETLDQFAQAYAAVGFQRQAYCTVYGLSEGSGTFDLHSQTVRPVMLNVAADALEHGHIVIVPPGQGRVLVGSGQPMSGQEIIIVNPETRQVVQGTQVGEIWIRGPQVADGYWRQPEATAQTFQARLDSGAGPYLRSGDSGFFQDQDLYITGRLKEMLIIHGKNFYAVDLELAAENAHPALLPASSAAFSISVEGEEQLVLIHEIRPENAAIDIAEVASLVRRRIGEHFFLPVHSVVLVEAGSVPRTETGKIRRAYARTLFLAELEAASLRA
ncbi:acyl-CoA synthetase [Deinococcus ruber]|uniref:Acyl-CoA synthetase n=1 Tax=Deinococcus ruber TaxID=1848197 RepID=A0A918FAJ8_9DEIO|nr:acyl-CoA synthetase [Deinococcus ruber]